MIGQNIVEQVDFESFKRVLFAKDSAYKSYRTVDLQKMYDNKHPSSLVSNQQVFEQASMPVTSGDLKEKYKILGTVFFSIGTRGAMAEEFNKRKVVYLHQLSIMKQKGQLSSSSRSVGQMIGGIGLDGAGDIGLAVQYAGASFKSNDMEIAFHILVAELQMGASYLGANAIVGFRHNIELDSNWNVINFFANVYGTAVKIEDESES
ncbi:MAG: hypothetical protein ABR955_07510 [Verrucomicrobiota bacterium]|jgi:hypothetical protein